MALEYVLNIKDDGSATIKKVGQNVDNLRKKVVDAEKSANIFCKSLSKMEAAVAGAGGILIAKGISALKDFAKEMINSYDSAAKLSNNIGVAAESVIGLRHAADLSGVGAEQMDKNMVKLSQTISKAASGNKAAADTFAKMGIEVKNTDGTLKNSERVLMEMADAFQKLPAGAERATLAMDVFGKSGASMVTMLKDGSGALREMSDEGKMAAGNVGDISKSMEKFNDAMVRGKAAVTGVLAAIADTSAFDALSKGIDSVAKSWIDFLGDFKTREQWAKDAVFQREALAKVEIKELSYQKKMLDFSGKSFKEQAKERAELEEKIEAARKGVNIEKEELEYLKKKGELRALNKQYEEKGALGSSDNRSRGLLKSQTNEYEAKKNAEAELAAAAAKAKADAEKAEAEALANYEANQQKKKELEDAAERARKQREAEASRDFDEAVRLEEQRLKEQSKEFEDMMGKKQIAIKSLAELDEKILIASLDGEEKKMVQAITNYEKRKAELASLHELELMYASDDEKFEILASQGERFVNLQYQIETEMNAIRKEFADKRKKNIEDIASFEKDMQDMKLSGFYLEESRLQSSHEKRREELRKLHEEEMAYAEDKEAALRAQNARMLALERSFADERNALNRGAAVQAASASLEAIGQITEGYKSYSALYKASQIGQAIINSVQAVLRTMAGVPYPFNVPLAALQAAAGAVQVRKIAATKMYAGGMIPGGDRYIRVNEEGPEAVLTTKGVRNAGGPAGVAALNNGPQSIRNSYDQRKSSVNVNLYPVMVTPETLRKSIEPVFKWNEQRW